MVGTLVVERASGERVGSALLERLRAGLIGEGEVVQGPYGPRRLVYADFTASGRAVDLVEDAIRAHVLPWYANTHSESTAAALTTTRLREEARAAIHGAVGGTDEHVVIFCGSGTTGAVAKLAAILGLPPRSDTAADAGPRPVVFVGPYEHHSNELPWRESAADVVAIPGDAQGRVDLRALETELVNYADRPLRIGSFSAASNVTGVLTDTAAVARMLHRHGALSFWDYAAAGPYVPIRVGESAPGQGDGKDAVFASPHKFLGGPQTPGVLIVRRDLVNNPVPTVPGGGVITFVSAEGHSYTDDPVMREEGGTPAIVESIRAGLAFSLKETIGTDLIGQLDEELLRAAMRRWSANPHLELLGNPHLPRLPIVSFRVRHGARYLHHHFVVALLSDLFGIQARGGCSCAGPYGHRLLVIGPTRSRAIGEQVALGRFGVKPGWARVTLHYAMSTATAGYVIEAVDLVARYGHRLLTEYRFDPYSGHWRHRDGTAPPPVRLAELLTETAPPRPVLGEDALAGQLATGRAILAAGADLPPDGPSGLPQAMEVLREYHLPPQCLAA